MSPVTPVAITWFAAVVLLLLDGRRGAGRWLAVAALAASVAAHGALAVTVLRSGSVESFAGGWQPGIGIVLRADALGAVFGFVSAVVLLICLVYEVVGGSPVRALPAIVLFLATGLSGLFLTGDAFNFYVFFEISMVSAFVLSSYGLGRRELRASLVFTVVNLLGSVVFLSGIATLYHVTGTLDMRQIGTRMLDVEPNSSILIATLIFAAFGLKLGLFPFHFWVPPVYRDSRPAVAAMLSGAVANIGSYGLLRFGGEVLAVELRFGAAVLMVIGAVSIVYGALLAVSGGHPADVLAYSSIGQAGYILVAVAAGGPVGYAAAVLYAVVNALSKTLLFLATGVRGPLVGAAFAIGAFSVAGIPPSAGFLGKLAMLQVAVAQSSAGLATLVVLGGALSFVYMLRIYQRTYWSGEAVGPTSAWSARAVVLGLAGLLVGLGLWPEPLVGVSQVAAAAVEHVAP
ncbi:MAG: oxidoreductase [Chloroflexota bacterium]|nr:oxidoreductase [Chloroflexota bacterium]